MVGWELEWGWWGLTGCSVGHLQLRYQILKKAVSNIREKEGEFWHIRSNMNFFCKPPDCGHHCERGVFVTEALCILDYIVMIHK